MSNAENVASKPDRLASLDQFRGYTVMGMFLVNFVGSYAAIAAFLPTLKHWNTHCSYADTIMPQFLFAVGFGFRMSYLKRLEKDGASLANWRVVRRILGLLLVAFIVHHLDGKYANYESLEKIGFWGLIQSAFQRDYFQTLAHIGLTSLWVVPVIGCGPLVRTIFAIGSCVLFVWLSSSWYYEWELERPGIDGGPLGFLTWTAPLIMGTLAFDIWQSQLKAKVLTIFSIGSIVMLIAATIELC
ncbi:MAG: heparan-alpha-glucosaminide N-acetyltransferase domain-containing protein [Pirellulales bacterium]